MTEAFIESLPEDLVSHVRAGCGAEGDAWLIGLPDIIRKLENTWSLKVGSPFPGIEFNFVSKAETLAGAPVVLKIAPPWKPVEIFGEAAYLRSRHGKTCVRLLSEDQGSRAILIERVFPGHCLWQHFAGEEMDSIDPAITVLKAVLLPVPEDTTYIDSLDRWYDGLRRFSETEFPADYATKALKIYDRLSRQPDHIFYLHGDFHPGNIVTDLRSSGFCVIDPKGISGHIGYEIGVFLNNFYWWQEKRPDIKERLNLAVQQFANVFDLDPFELREWCFAQQVIGSWWNYKDMPDLYDGGVVKADIWDV
jgi:streptomycin 6-kinase